MLIQHPRVQLEFRPAQARRPVMAAVVRDFKYSKARGRGRGILGIRDFDLSRKPGTEASSQADSRKDDAKAEQPKTARGKVLVTLYNYKANPDAPGGFKELSIQKGQLLEWVSEREDNEHWWEVKNEDGDTGFVPSSYVIKREDQTLPWLIESALKSEEEERKERVKRLAQEKAALEGKGYGPAPKDLSSLPPKKYVSAYKREEGGQSSAGGAGNYYCEVCDKKLNGPKPYQAHMASKAHKEELALLEES